MQGGGFHPWNPVDFTLKSGGFHPWNLVDFTQISPVKSTQSYKSKCFSKNSSVWWMQGRGLWPRISWNPPDFTLKSGRFHPWNLVDFTHEIWQILPRFHLWNPSQNYKSKCFSKNSSVWWMQGRGYDQDFMKSTRFHPEIWQIWPVKSSGFLPDITCEIHPKL